MHIQRGQPHRIAFHRRLRLSPGPELAAQSRIGSGSDPNKTGQAGIRHLVEIPRLRLLLLGQCELACYVDQEQISS